MTEFEGRKNFKASAYTAILLGLIVLLFFVISWSNPPTKEIKTEEGMEVNLGNSETGNGDLQPLIQDSPAPEEDPINNSAANNSKPNLNIKEIETDDNDKDAPKIESKKTVSENKKKTITTKPSETVKQNNNDEINPIEKAPNPALTPKILYKASNSQGKGGNNADSYQKSSGQGVTAGPGDQGKINGDPNSNNYTGVGGNGNGGVFVSRGLQGRKINRFPSFEDDFRENAKVAVDITVDEKGNVINAIFQQKGSTTANSNIISIALKKAKQLKFNVEESGIQEQIGTIIFNFRIRN